MQRTFTLALALALIVGAPAVAASQAHWPAVSATRPHHKPCDKAHPRRCHEMDSLQFSLGQGITTPPHASSERAGSTELFGQLNVHKPKRRSCRGIDDSFASCGHASKGRLGARVHGA
jgi:hypothetical protein